MKTQLLKFLTVATLLMVGCSQDAIDFDTDGSSSGSDDNIVDMNSVGYLSFENLVLNIDADMEGFVDSGTTAEAMMTRTDAATADVAIEDYTIELSKESDGTVVETWSYSEILKLTSPVEYDAGYYVIKAYSEKEIPASQWNHEIYTSAEKSITVGDSNTTTVPSLTCSLATIKAHVSIGVDVKESFDMDNEENPFLITLSLGDEDAVFTEEIMDNGDIVYFAPQEDNTTLNIMLSGVYITESGEPTYLEWFNTVENVTAGQWRKISIKIDNYNEGQIEIGCTVEGWTTDETLGVEISSQIFNFAMVEDSIFDPDDETTDANAPVLTLAGMDIEDTYYFTEESFNESSQTYSPMYVATITPEGDSSVSTAYIEISSTNMILPSVMDNMGYTDGKMTLWGSGMTGNDYVSIEQVGSTLVATLTYEGAQALYKYAGTHSIKCVVVDSEGRRLFQTLTINVVSTGAPQIVYIGGDFDTPIDLDTTPTGGYYVVIDISSSASDGLSSLYLAINSPILTEEELNGMNLSSNMDVANVDPTSGTYTTLMALGIPCCDAVLGQSYVRVDISEFMSLLGGLGTGTTTFTLTAIDAQGECSVTLTAIRTK